MTDPKPMLSRAGILSNICYYENLVKTSQTEWCQHLASLQHWLEQLDLVKDGAE
jgi:hypothetical protein